jgi:hypothetical protein
MEMGGQFHAPAASPPGTHLIVGCEGTRAGLDSVEKRKISFPCLESNLSRPAHSPSIYRLSYRSQ